jgi:carbon storage regulator
MLVITRKIGESIMINDDIEISVLELGKDKVKFGVKAPRNVKIMRSELIAAQSTNVEAAKTAALSKDAMDALMKFKAIGKND